MASSLNNSVTKRINALEFLIHQDLGKRGIGPLMDSGSLLSVAQGMIQSQRIAILTGFFIPSAMKPENDGPLGALSIVKSLLYLKKKAIIITDDMNEDIFRKSIQFFHKQRKDDNMAIDDVKLEIFPSLSNYNGNPKDYSEECEMMAKNILDQYQIDFVFAIERPGPAKDGKYYNMVGTDFSEFVGHTHSVMTLAKQRNIKTAAVGDGGNELGMGKLMEDIEKYIPNGGKIACSVAADHAIVCGVSNWGGYAISAALSLLTHQQPEGSSTHHTHVGGMVPLVSEDRGLLEYMIQCGCVDGILKKPIMSVDGLDYDTVHAQVLNRITDIALFKTMDPSFFIQHA